MLLPKTSKGLNQLRAEFVSKPGKHRLPQKQSVPRGKTVNRVDFDLSAHSIEQMDPLHESYLGLPQARINRTKESMPIHVFVHGGQQPELSSQWQFLRDARLQMLTELALAAAEAVSPRDMGSLVLMGTARLAQIPRAKILEGSEDPNVAASELVRVSEGRGFSLLISDDFMSLMAGGLGKARANSFVGIKVSDPVELELPANLGTVSFGGFNEVDTDDPVQLTRANQALAAQHQGILSDLQNAKIFTASAVYDGFQPHGFDAAQLDEDVARALFKTVTTKS